MIKKLLLLVLMTSVFFISSAFADFDLKALNGQWEGDIVYTWQSNGGTTTQTGHNHLEFFNQFGQFYINNSSGTVSTDLPIEAFEIRGNDLYYNNKLEVEFTPQSDGSVKFLFVAEQSSPGENLQIASVWFLMPDGTLRYSEIVRDPLHPDYKADASGTLLPVSKPKN